MKTTSTLIHNISSEKLAQEITAIFRKELEDLKTSFQPKEPGGIFNQEKSF